MASSHPVCPQGSHPSCSFPTISREPKLGLAVLISVGLPLQLGALLPLHSCVPKLKSISLPFLPRSSGLCSLTPKFSDQYMILERPFPDSGFLITTLIYHLQHPEMLSQGREQKGGALLSLFSPRTESGSCLLTNICIFLHCFRENHLSVPSSSSSSSHTHRKTMSFPCAGAEILFSLVYTNCLLLTVHFHTVQ